jgi:hypothetical protein
LVGDRDKSPFVQVAGYCVPEQASYIADTNLRLGGGSVSRFLWTGGT